MTLDALYKKLNKDYSGVATPGHLYPSAEFISSGNPKFDSITGGGFARGHMTEVHGLEGSGKTTFCIQGIAYAQSQGLQCAYVDAEGRINPDRCEEMGISMQDLMLIRPDYGEQACDIMRDIIESGEVDLLVLDSLPALSSKSEMEATDGGGQIANQAKMWAQFLRRIVPGFKNRKTAFVVINQMRENLMLNQYAPGAKDLFTFPGGRAQKYHASNRVEIKKLEKASETGYKVRFKSIKTSFTKPFMEMDDYFDWDTGFQGETSLLDVALESGVLTRDGAGYFFEGTKIAHGQNKMKDWLMVPENIEKLQNAIANH